MFCMKIVGSALGVADLLQDNLSEVRQLVKCQHSVVSRWCVGMCDP